MKQYFKFIFYRICDLMLFMKKAVTPNGLPIQPAAVKAILVCETALLGDVVCLYSLLRQLKKRFPDSEITLLVQKPFSSVYGYHPLVSRQIVLENTGFSGVYRVITRLFKERWDLVLSPSPGLRNAVVALSAALMTRRSIVAGYLTNASTSPHFYQDHCIRSSIVPVPSVAANVPGLWYGKHEHLTVRAQKSLLPVTRFTVRPEQSVLHLEPNQEGQHLIFLMRQGWISRDRFTVVVHPSASQPLKEWPLENFIRLIQLMSDHFSLNMIFILIGTARDTNRLEAIQNRTSGTVHQMVDHPLERVMTLIKHADLFIGNDSGPKFLADGLNLKVIEIMGSLPPATAGVLNPESSSFYANEHCSPCNQATCPNERQCLAVIRPEPVFEMVLKMVAGTTGNNASISA